jgi:hypothetical protein
LVTGFRRDVITIDAIKAAWTTAQFQRQAPEIPSNTGCRTKKTAKLTNKKAATIRNRLLVSLRPSHHLIAITRLDEPHEGEILFPVIRSLWYEILRFRNIFGRWAQTRGGHDLVHDHPLQAKAD